jgi:hypothetical protein
MKRRIPAATLLTLVLVLAPQVKSETELEKKRDTQPKKPIVILTIDYGDGAQKRFPTIPWKKEMTVLTTLEWAAKHPRGIAFQLRGKGATTLISKIDDLKNSGADEKNWIFRVNDELGDRSCGVFPVKVGDRILWRFERYQ